MATAEAVCSTIGGLEVDVLEGLQSLLDKSLVRQIESGGEEPRFTMLETIREYAQERLAVNEEAAAQALHAEHYVGFVEGQVHKAWGPERRHWFVVLGMEHENIRAALQWLLHDELPESETRLRARANARAEQALRLSVAMSAFWRVANPADGQAWIQASLAAAHGAPVPLRQKALTSLGWIMLEQGDHSLAQHYLEMALELARQFDDAWNLGEALRGVGNTAMWQADYARAEAFFEESLALARREQNASAHVFSLWCLSHAAYLREDYEQALTLTLRSRQILDEHGLPWGRPIVLDFLARLAHRRGDERRAKELFRESLVSLRPSGELWVGVDVMGGLAGSAAATGEAHHAARLLGAVDSARRSQSAPHLGALTYADAQRAMAAVRALLDDAIFEAAWAEGRAMTLEQAIAYALSEVSDA